MEIEWIEDMLKDGEREREREREREYLISRTDLIFFRSLMERYQYSPLIHLEKNFHTGLIRLNNDERSFQDQIIQYFKSRQEDHLIKSNSIINTAIKSSRPIVSPNDVFVLTDDLSFHHHTSSIEDISSGPHLNRISFDEDDPMF